MIHRPYFFHVAKRDLFQRVLTQSQVDGLNVFLDWYDTENPPIPEQHHLDDRSFAYVLATAFHETAQTMVPVVEYGGERYLKSKNYYPWYGRGHVQLTWEANYRKQDAKLGLDGALIANPDLALDPVISMKVLLFGMADGDFTGKKLGDFFTDMETDFFKARTIVNAFDQAARIAGYAELFANAITHT